MKHALLMMVASGLTATWVGCQSATDSTAPNSAGDSTAPGAKLVSLKVPNMT